jgi:secondary thiamine-phosphate synthase enzyme
MDSQVAAAPTGFMTSRIPVRTEGARQFTDLTTEVQARVDAAGFRSGLAVVSTLHTTASLVVNEHEPELLKDLEAFLEALAPQHATYAHNSVPCLPGEGPNAHAHCQALLLHASVTVPIVEGRLSLGRWQRIFLVELDCARDRSVSVSLLGA